MWRLWQPGQIITELTDIEPRLASWDRHDHPSQVRLRSYLQTLVARIGDLARHDNLFLDLTVGIDDPAKLLRHHDLENYLTPILASQAALPNSKFVFARARKLAQVSSSLRIGIAVDSPTTCPNAWNHLTIAPRGSTQSKAWKQQIHDALVASNTVIIPPGPVNVILAWRCAVRRNWVSLWKPTGDAMGPVLGYARPGRLFHPNDDRIVELECHRIIAQEYRNEVDVGLWWQHSG